MIFRACLSRKHTIVVCDNYVTLTDGTGVVHIAPAFGEDDSNGGKKVQPAVFTACRRQR